MVGTNTTSYVLHSGESKASFRGSCLTPDYYIDHYCLTTVRPSEPSRQQLQYKRQVGGSSYNVSKLFISFYISVSHHLSWEFLITILKGLARGQDAWMILIRVLTASSSPILILP